MPDRPPKPCRKSGCNAISREANGFCSDHQEYAAELDAQRRKRGDQFRGSAGERGYDSKWSDKVRPAYLKRHPVCERCGRAKEVVVHHKDENPRNNKWENLMTMCRNCHELHHGRKR